MAQPIVEISTLIIHDAKVVLGKDENGKWRLPGGKINQFESCQDAAVRTFRETTGISIKANNILFINEDISIPEERHRIIVYAYGEYVEGVIGEQMPTYTDIQWVDVRELGPLQADMTDEVLDGFFKISLVLKQQASRTPAQA